MVYQPQYGLEQGFTLDSQPEGYQSDQPVQVSLALEGNVQPRWEQEGQVLGFYDDEQHKAFSYSKLIAHDATGKTLLATMRLADSHIVLEVDTQSHLARHHRPGIFHRNQDYRRGQR